MEILLETTSNKLLDPPKPRIRRGINRIQDLSELVPGENLYSKKELEASNKGRKKNFLLSDIKAHFRLENDDLEKRTLVSCGTKWKAFKTVKFMLKKVQATRELAQGFSESKAGVDPLILVLGPEHEGRTRGVECDIGYKKGIEGYARKRGPMNNEKILKRYKMKNNKVNRMSQFQQGVLTKHVMPQHENAPSIKKGKGNEPPKEPNKQDKALEETTNHQKTMQKINEVKERVEKEKAANRKSLQALEDEVLLNKP
nr:protein exportin 1A [Tanacetum cinerariifolium]